MIDFLQSAAAFIIAIGLLITFHEFGHYWVARRCNVKILRFSIGFGKPVWRFDFSQPFWHLGFTHSPWKPGSLANLFKQREFDKDETEFVLAALPLGGYVKMLDEREGNVPEEEKPYAFSSKPLSQRFAIVFAGPAFNFIFAIFAYWIIYVAGVTGLKPVVGDVLEGSIAMQAGFSTGQEILEIDGQRTPTWGSVVDRTVRKVVSADTMTFVVRDSNGNRRSIDLDLSVISIDEMATGRLLEQLGIQPDIPEFPAVIGEVSAGGAAEQAGLRKGDHIIAVEGVPIGSWNEWVEYIRSSPGKSVTVELLRDTQVLNLTVVPEPIILDSGETIGRIGAALDTRLEPDRDLYARDKYSVFPALVKSFDRTWEMSLMTLQILGKMIIGEASVKNLSGPITIAKYAGDTANIGIVAFLGFLAIVSISLGILNLLPIPMLDGGHLFYYLIEWIKGSPVSESFQIIGQQVGLVFLFGLMGIAFYNDILRLFQ